MPETIHERRQSIPIEAPDVREYEQEADANLDRKLCEAIRAAENADNEWLARVLALHCGSHYYDRGE